MLNKYVLPFQFSLFSPVCSRAECLQAVLLLHSHQHQCGSPAGCPTVPCDASLHFSSCVPQRNHFRYVSNSSQSPWTHVPWSRLCWNGSRVSNWYLWQDCVGTSTTTPVMTSEWTVAWWRELLQHLPNPGKLKTSVLMSSCSLEIPAAKTSPGVHRKSWTSCVLSHVMLFSHHISECNTGFWRLCAIENFAQFWCSKLTDPSGVFAPCHPVVSPNTYRDVGLKTHPANVYQHIHLKKKRKNTFLPFMASGFLWTLMIWFHKVLTVF